MVAHTCHPSYSGGRGRRISSSRPVWIKLATACLKSKIKTQRRKEGITPMVESTPGKREALAQSTVLKENGWFFSFLGK